MEHQKWILGLFVIAALDVVISSPPVTKMLYLVVSKDEVNAEIMILKRSKCKVFSIIYIFFSFSHKIERIMRSF